MGGTIYAWAFCTLIQNCHYWVLDSKLEADFEIISYALSILNLSTFYHFGPQ